MIDKRIIADPAAHYGDPRRATQSFRWQRVTGGINLACLMFLIWLVVRLAEADRAEMVSVIANPLVAIPLAVLLVNVAVHMRIGMREIIEDYLDEGRTNRLAMALNTLFALAIAGLGLVALVKIVFWG